MAEPSVLDALMQWGDSTHMHLAKLATKNPLKNDPANNLMLTHGLKEEQIAVAMEGFSITEKAAQENFAYTGYSTIGEVWAVNATTPWTPPSTGLQRGRPKLITSSNAHPDEAAKRALRSPIQLLHAVSTEMIAEAVDFTHGSAGAIMIPGEICFDPNSELYGNRADLRPDCWLLEDLQCCLRRIFFRF